MLPALSWTTPPYWTKPVPSSLSADTLKVEPDTENDAAIAPFAMPTTIAPTTATAGTQAAGDTRPPGPPSTRGRLGSFSDTPPAPGVGGGFMGVGSVGAAVGAFPPGAGQNPPPSA